MRRYSFTLMEAMPLSAPTFSSREKHSFSNTFRFSHTGSPSISRNCSSVSGSFG